jgi:hypothetical protein
MTWVCDSNGTVQPAHLLMSTTVPWSVAAIPFAAVPLALAVGGVGLVPPLAMAALRAKRVRRVKEDA